MADVVLNGFDVVAVLQGEHSVGVTHVVKANCWNADTFYDPLEVFVDRNGEQMTSCIVGEYQIPFVTPH